MTRPGPKRKSRPIPEALVSTFFMFLGVQEMMTALIADPELVEDCIAAKRLMDRGYLEKVP